MTCVFTAIRMQPHRWAPRKIPSPIHNPRNDVGQKLAVERARFWLTVAFTLDAGQGHASISRTLPLTTSPPLTPPPPRYRAPPLVQSAQLSPTRRRYRALPLAHNVVHRPPLFTTPRADDIAPRDRTPSSKPLCQHAKCATVGGQNAWFNFRHSLTPGVLLSLSYPKAFLQLSGEAFRSNVFHEC